MIKHTNGHWRSEITREEEAQILDELMNDPKFTDEEKEAVKLLINDMLEARDSSELSDQETKFTLIDEVAADQWEEVPLPIEEWLASEYHIGDIASSLYPKVKEDLISIFKGDYYECIFTGCIDKDAIVTCEDGSMPRLGDLIGVSKKVTTVDIKDGVKHYQSDPGVDSGVKRVINLVLSNGMDVRLTPDHKVLTQRGWVPSRKLLINKDAVVLPKKVTYTPSYLGLSDDRVVEIAHLIAETKNHSLEVPDIICRSPLDKIALFINTIWSARNPIYGQSIKIEPSIIMESKKFIRQLQLLLLRFGILSDMHKNIKGGWVVSITDEDSINSFNLYIKNLEIPDTSPSQETVLSKVKSTNYVNGLTPVADIGVPGPHRFLANGINVHNSIGWGKSMLATTCMVRIIYELLCLKDPQKTLGIAPSEPIYLVPISSRKDLANKVAFGGIASKLNVIDYFKGRFQETKEEIKFKDKRIFITGGSSNDASVLGLNVICAMVDESNFMGTSKKGTTGVGSKNVYDRAQTIYNTLVRRVQSRFERAGVKGMIFLVSSKRGADDFTERRIREARDNKELGVFVRDYASWEVTPDYYKNQEWHKMLISPESGRSRILKKGEEADEGGFVIDFPDDFISQAQKDPEGFIRDIAGVALNSVTPFIAKRESIDVAMNKKQPNAFKDFVWNTESRLDINWDLITQPNAYDDPVPLCCPNSFRHVHLDMSKKWDATGFCCAHLAGVIQVEKVDLQTNDKYIEEVPIIHVDGVLRIVAPTSGEINHEKVREQVYRLLEGGIPIRSVSMDQWCAPPNLQLFKRKGLKTKELSVDRKFDPYLSLRAAIYEERIIIPRDPFLRKELRDLEISDNGKKVDHPIHSSKDLADALCGAVYYLTDIAKAGGVPVVPSKGLSLGTGPIQNSMMVSNGNIVWKDEISDNSKLNNDDDLPSWIVI